MNKLIVPEKVRLNIILGCDWILWAHNFQRLNHLWLFQVINSLISEDGEENVFNVNWLVNVWRWDVVIHSQYFLWEEEANTHDDLHPKVTTISRHVCGRITFFKLSSDSWVNYFEKVESPKFFFSRRRTSIFILDIFFKLICWEQIRFYWMCNIWQYSKDSIPNDLKPIIIKALVINDKIENNSNKLFFIVTVRYYVSTAAIIKCFPFHILH